MGKLFHLNFLYKSNSFSTFCIFSKMGKIFCDFFYIMMRGLIKINWNICSIMHNRHFDILKKRKTFPFEENQLKRGLADNLAS